MSMHKQPLTTIEEAGLIVHGMGRQIGKPSQAADIFRSGVSWGLRTAIGHMESIQSQLDHGMPFDDDLRARLAALLAEMVRDNTGA